MKRTKTILAAVLACVLLAGCASDTAPAEETKPAAIPETTAAAPETVAVIPETEAPAELTEETEVPDGTEAPFEVTVTPVITEDQTQVTVATADEFLAAIAPNTEIIVDTELMDLSKAAGYGTASSDYYRWVETFDGPELYIAGVSNLTIRGAGEDHNAVVISAQPRYANVLNFENCSNIMVKGLTAGHAEEPGSCAGGVLCFMNSQDVLVEDCGLFGCGTLGVKGYNSKNMQIVNNDIYECSIGGVEFTNCDAVNVDGNLFRDLGGPIFRVYDCGSITCNGVSVHDFMRQQ